ncbi:MAG: hypothetical protein sL5_06190 [Candidatus Mesenet longicola]|uniref:Uncharacterized protein n=1 Tax=Candidatus Mesenet longicola TaxID=1892558 RepID=A0A8J3HY02_9RICK|nr:MAG: hypothetical protein sGL2_03220 [Candidatus Mesenet longicola]GHM59626.1 MAG: hypothetical protein sL5_06190 [Candidatus Mesenet longicola]
MKNQITGKLPIGVIVTLIIQTVTAVWWLARLDMKVHSHDQLIEHNNQLVETVYRLEERVKSLSEELDEFKINVSSMNCK